MNRLSVSISSVVARMDSTGVIPLPATRPT
ncbi:Uncharacterised protein [Mycobacterium tuberculosis]|nr:Uncharacterised protein [Mycobacterium tuberculosis]CPA57338.1 Uncharacterised protein [Mycobacterium tuberculosis]